MGNEFEKKLRILCLHGHATSAKVLEKELEIWPDSVLKMMDLVCIDAPFPIDPSTFVSKFDPPYYEWFRDDWDQVSKNFAQTIAYVEEKMISLGPFDGVLGFSQGGAVAAVLTGLQRQGVALTRVPQIKFMIIISGPKFGGSFKLPCPEQAKDAYPIVTPSLLIMGEKDAGIKYQLELMEAVVHPTVLFHPGGHMVPHLDDNGVEIVTGFLISQIQGYILKEEETERMGSCLYYLNFLSSLFCFKKRIDMKKSSRVDSLN